MRLLLSLLILPLFILFRVLSPKRNYYFYAPMELKGNIKYLYDFYSKKGKKTIKINKEEINKLTLLQYIKFLFSIGNSKSIFLSHGIGGLPISCLFSKRVQLWHGYPIKKILLNSKFDTIKYKSKILNNIYLFFYKLRIKISYSYLVTSDSILGNELADSFKYKKNKILYLGSPSQEIAENQKKQETLDAHKILYLPTWRDGKNNIIDIIQSILNFLDDDFLEENNIFIDIKLHPYEMKKIKFDLNKSNRINFITNDISDMINLYTNYDCLITDYSSACFEFSPMGGQVIFFAPDLIEYINERGLTINYGKLARQKEVHSVIELKNAIYQSKHNSKEYYFDYKLYVGSSNKCMELIYDKF